MRALSLFERKVHTFEIDGSIKLSEFSDQYLNMGQENMFITLSHETDYLSYGTEAAL